MKENDLSVYNYHLMPEIMIGINKNIMVHAEGFISNRNSETEIEGGAIYLKYRFYSQDEVHSHFRLAAYGKASYNNSDIHQSAIDLNGHNSGYEAGIVATKLINKIALSAGSSFVHALDNGNNNKWIMPSDHRNAISYNLSIGKLMLPKEYTSYEQTNLNLMVEFLGQTNTGMRKTFIDLAPSAQLIFLSKMRLDIGYRFPVYNKLERSADRGFLVRLEYNFFNAFK